MQRCAGTVTHGALRHQTPKSPPPYIPHPLPAPPISHWGTSPHDALSPYVSAQQPHPHPCIAPALPYLHGALRAVRATPALEFRARVLESSCLSHTASPANFSVHFE